MNFGTWKSCGLVSRWTAKSEKKPYGTRPSRADCFLSWSIFILCRKIFLLVEQARQILHVFIDGGSQRHFRRFRCRFSSVADWLLSMMTPSAVNFFVMSLLRLMDHLTVHNIQKKTLLIFTAHPWSSSMETQNSSDVGGRPGENCAPITLDFFFFKRENLWNVIRHRQRDHHLLTYIGDCCADGACCIWNDFMRSAQLLPTNYFALIRKSEEKPQEKLVNLTQ